MKYHIYVVDENIAFSSFCFVSKAKKSASTQERHKDKEAMKAFGRKIRILRVTKDLTIEQFANNIGLHASQISRIERGETNVTISTITFLAKALDVKPGDLLQR